MSAFALLVWVFFSPLSLFFKLPCFITAPMKESSHFCSSYFHPCPARKGSSGGGAKMLAGVNPPQCVSLPLLEKGWFRLR